MRKYSIPHSHHARRYWICLRQGPPSILGVYANLMTRSNVLEILRVAKEAGWKTWSEARSRAPT